MSQSLSTQEVSHSTQKHPSFFDRLMAFFRRVIAFIRSIFLDRPKAARVKVIVRTNTNSEDVETIEFTDIKIDDITNATADDWFEYDLTLIFGGAQNRHNPAYWFPLAPNAQLLQPIIPMHDNDFHYAIYRASGSVPLIEQAESLKEKEVELYFVKGTDSFYRILDFHYRTEPV